MAPPGETWLDLQQAADALGVHYQTAYRWVRSGRLPAELVGGRYCVAVADIATVEQSRRTPRNPPSPSHGRLDRAADRMYAALIAGDESAATRAAHRLVDEGTSMVDLLQTVLVPPLVKIGDAWHAGELTVWVEHRASQIVERILGQLSPNPRGRRRGTAVVAALSGDHHSLPTAMAATALRDDNWHVQHFGADLPPDEIVKYCDGHDVSLAVITVTNLAVRGLADATAKRLRSTGTPTIVGGAGRTVHDLIKASRAAGSAQQESCAS